MAYRISWKITSKKHPDKIYSSHVEFWDDHINDEGIELKNSSSLKGKFFYDGTLLSDDMTLGDDGKYVIRTKVYSDKDAYLKYVNEITLSSKEILKQYQTLQNVKMTILEEKIEY